MKKWKSFTAEMLIVVLAITGCATTPEGKISWNSPEACIAAYTAGGAGLGGLLGKLIGGETEHVAMGAAAGGLLAFAYAWGKCFSSFSKVESQQILGYSETAKTVKYSSNQGTVVKIKNFNLDPIAIPPGGTAKFKANYYVMTPESKDIKVVETRTLKVFDPNENKYVEAGQVPEETVISPGMRNADGVVSVPSGVTEGKFIIAFKINAEENTDEEEMPFVVTSDEAALAKVRKDRARHGRDETPLVRTNAPSGGEKALKSGEKIVQIIQGKVNLRSEPNPKSALVGVVTQGEKYPVIQIKEVMKQKWFKIRLDDGRTSWLIGTAARIVEQ